ncbi:MAG: exosome complex protein Rrp42 [Candidatus Methanomethylicia archaeon]|nr:exosome complex protein Rrp42 [Candidatus Methanomethylicia archaeon]MCX8169037.1 exosome complex protein Rrp42 [Candidatus Methanomethylicia archaeon]MDW7988769.1 exosome complex protein Rrp42 [Nitrososphaerota archaeon]
MFTPISIPVNREFVLNSLAKGVRSGGRGLHDYRPIKIEFDIISKANGSASVKIGDTYILVGIKTEIGRPFPDTPNEGVLIVNSEFLPFASPQFEAGPPDENAIELARVIDRGLRHSNAIDLKDLCIIPNEKVWILWVDIYVLDYGGDLFDATALASFAALLTTRIPVVVVEGSQVIVKDEKRFLKINDYPVAVTINKISNYLLIDPTPEELNFTEARLTIFTNSKGSICAIQKGLSGSFTYDEILKAIELAQLKGKELRAILLDSFDKWRKSDGVR